MAEPEFFHARHMPSTKRAESVIPCPEYDLSIQFHALISKCCTSIQICGFNIAAMQEWRWFGRLTLPICGVQENVRHRKTRKEKEMAVFETTPPSVIGASVTDRIARSMIRVFSALMTWNDGRATRKALSRLSDRELDDIGLSRGDILAMSSRK